MKAKSLNKPETGFKKVAAAIVTGISSFWTILFSFILISSWLVYGWRFGFTDTLQMILHISLSIVTFFMVLLIQHTEYRDNLAMQIKLDELLKGVKGSSDSFINIQKQPDNVLKTMQNKVVSHKKAATKRSNSTQDKNVDNKLR